MNRVVALTAGMIFCLGSARVWGQPLPEFRHADSLSRGFASALRSISSPALEERKALRRSLQQRGHATSVRSSLEADGLTALLALLRARLQVALSISHRPLSVHYEIKRPPGWPRLYYEVVLTDDWSFPADPWRKP